MIYPDRVDHYRRVTTIDANGQEKAAAPTTINVNLRAWIVRPDSSVTQMPFGQAELANDTILLEPYDANQELIRVEHGDFFVDRETKERWNARGPGDPIRLPSSFASVTPRYSHVEVTVVRSDLEADGVRPEEVWEP